MSRSQLDRSEIVSRRRLWAYLGTLLVFLAAAELAARTLEDIFAAVSHRVLFKAALLERRGPTRVLFVGTSRLNDGVAPSKLSRRLGPAFNASVPSSSMETMEYLLQRGLGRGDLGLVALEVSTAQAHSGELDIERPSTDGVTGWSTLLRHQRALAIENLPRFVGLLLAPLFDGSEWFRDRWLTEGLKEALGRRPGGTPPGGSLAIIPPDGLGARPLADPDLERAAAVYEKLAERVGSAGARLALVVPPQAARLRGTECNPEFLAFLCEVARRSRAPVVDASCIDVPDDFFSDRANHLGAAGRAWFSAALSAALLERLEPTIAGEDAP